MEPKLKEKQPQHSGFQSAAGEPDKMSTSCLMPKTKRSDTEEKLTTELEEPITVHTSEPDSRQSRFWRLNDPLEASNYSKIEPMRFWDPKITCDGSCRCYPAQALQVCGLSISSKDGSPITGAKISGFFAIRDHYDRRRIYIFKHEKEDEIDIVFKNVRQTAYLSYPIYFLSLLPIILFIFLVATAVAYYSKDRVEGETPYI